MISSLVRLGRKMGQRIWIIPELNKLTLPILKTTAVLSGSRLGKALSNDLPLLLPMKLNT